MTNEQLAVLLGSYSERLKAISEDIEAALPEGTERALEWWHEGKRVAAFRQDWDKETLECEGYEARSTGGFLILIELKRFILALQGDVHELNLSKMIKRTKCS